MRLTCEQPSDNSVKDESVAAASTRKRSQLVHKSIYDFLESHSAVRFQN